MSHSPPAAVNGGGTGSVADNDEIMLFGVRVKVDPLRKTVSMNNLSEYDTVSNKECKNTDSADDAVPPPCNGSRERNQGTPWKEEEHKRFLIGLQNLKKGDWKGISKNYVKTRTPTQVASHAQKYFKRMSKPSHHRRRSSLFDITVDSVPPLPIEEATRPHRTSSTPLLVAQPPPLFISPVLFSTQNNYPMEIPVPCEASNSSSILVRPPHVPHQHIYSQMADLNLDQPKPSGPLPSSWKLSLS